MQVKHMLDNKVSLTAKHTMLYVNAVSLLRMCKNLLYSAKILFNMADLLFAVTFKLSF